eukprot:c14618_g1_i2.p1 GENE.c14618_g1_i2~~c14618_g1_i2.p1  ORF type:complete len:163 (-),score=57.45 c14618_g1_i2:78-566(-)
MAEKVEKVEKVENKEKVEKVENKEKKAEKSSKPKRTGFFAVEGPLYPWASNMIMQTCLLLVMSALVASFEEGFAAIYSGVALMIIFPIEYPVTAIVDKISIWHNYAFRGFVYLLASAPLYAYPTVAILPGIPMSLGGLLYLWSGYLGEKYVPESKKGGRSKV